MVSIATVTIPAEMEPQTGTRRSPGRRTGGAVGIPPSGAGGARGAAPGSQRTYQHAYSESMWLEGLALLCFSSVGGGMIKREGIFFFVKNCNA